MSVKSLRLPPVQPWVLLTRRMSNSRRKHVLQNSLTGHVEPPTEGQLIVKAVGSRGGNIVEVHPHPPALSLSRGPSPMKPKGHV